MKNKRKMNLTIETICTRRNYDIKQSQGAQSGTERENPIEN